MGRKKELKNAISRLVHAEEEDFKYLKSQGIGFSVFFRQSVKALKDGKFKFKYI